MKCRWLAVAGLLAGSAMAAPALDGELTIVGSDSANVLLVWAEAFRERHPAVGMQIHTTGSASAPVALVEGAADLGVMSRPMHAAETRAFEQRHGYAPTRFVVAHDAIVVIVHPDNPLQSLTLAQVDAIFSATRACGLAEALRDWNELPQAGQTGEPRPILAVGRDAGSGTFERFREIALCGGRYRDDVVAWPGSGAVVAAVARYPRAIGYAGAGAVDGIVRPLAIARDAATPAEPPAEAAIVEGRYPLARAVYVYVNRPPRRDIPRLPAAFLEHVLSESGQTSVRREGSLPLAPAELAAQRALLKESALPP